MREYSVKIAEDISNILKEDDWSFNFDEDTGIFRMGVSNIEGFNNVMIRIIVNDDSYAIHVIAPINAPVSDAESKNKYTEFFCRANFGLKYGSFDFDVSDGEIMYRAFNFCLEQSVDKGLFLSSIACCASTLSRYADGILGMVFGNLSVDEAIAKVER